ncbi:hypothetical protein LV564_11460 [Komagataeibacter nataicola]|nr:hypothetical protein [Komagataeibacter nataicola]WEQ54782.1 hypothetical protein LV564_11460 [Komagataeibacter nataicola]
MAPYDRQTVTKLVASASDIGFARDAAEHLLKKKWYNRMPWSRGKVYFHQSAYVTTLVVSYGRVFEVGKRGYNFPNKLLRYEADEKVLHTKLLSLRNKVHAHSDLDRWSVRPWHADGFSTEIVGQPFHVIEEADIRLFLAMTSKLLTRISVRHEEIVAPYRAATPPPRTTLTSLSWKPRWRSSRSGNRSSSAREGF